ncbi:MSMEG_0565 family glycosyltransferase [Pseudonocardia ailaonensis]|uniref:MSMEG_0565 family glycosyltransferase n=1 Tax=Pseudonocardia ailaonensis TaxID=367279 RepID=A0ABN2MVZ6_9PSEU
MRVAIVSHSTTPRGGFVHALSLAEELHRQGADVHLLALGQKLFRPVTVPHTLLPGPTKAGTTLTERVFASIDLLEQGLSGLAGDFDVLHTQDCIAARAAVRVRAAGAPVTVVRTVHHVDDFTTPALVDCQRQAVLEPDHVLVVSEQWRDIVRTEYGRDSDVVHNGVDPHRFPDLPAGELAAMRARIGADGRFLFLGVGGVEPRKGTLHAFRALARLRKSGVDAMLALVGGHSFQDYADYREAALAELPELGLALGRDVILLGTVPDAELGGWYRAADALCFPSVKEGWGLAVLEAMAAGLPVVASDLPVFREYLQDGVSALLPAAADEEALTAAMRALVEDADLRDKLRSGADAVLPRYTWAETARRHREIYAALG